MLRRKRRPASRDGGVLRSERRSGGGGQEDRRPDDDRPDAPQQREGTFGDRPDVELRRRRGSRPAPVASLTTLGALLLLVLALIFLL